MKKLFILIFFFLLISIKLYSEEIMIMKLKNGEIELELYPDVAPNHVKRFKDLEIRIQKTLTYR